ncbi:Acetyltransferase (GNAT) domain-containing protein [Lentzea albidocapillata subsp. violacea]|uniref:Acetyltransferase (GNAT) domain-containing protein n=1 Tax=Lentzea albidocapillata subsp. violacea TaxID=128104 RepID=A0A1G8RGE2_9PSEU|nr:GNAT family N-acetyltransferase [Lentzea albidocapillata]SDJ16028.1 Acetyltransferase (GNAT) domain-containing protein [Lentzea albidocapillata subsp. violacea]
MSPVLISDTGLAAEIAALINRVYCDAEKGIWLEGQSRTTEAEVAELVATGQIAVVRSGDRIVGSVRVHEIEDGVGEFGMLVAAPEERGTGIGTDLVSFAENWGRARGFAEMQLELLVPQTWEHPVKEFLRGWYTRVGYRLVRKDSLESAYPFLVPHLACPCDFLVFRKFLDPSK